MAKLISKNANLQSKDSVRTYQLPQVDVYPKEWQINFRDNFGDLKFRDFLYKTIYTKKKQKSGTKKGSFNNETDIDDELYRLYKVWEAAGKPKINTTTVQERSKKLINRPNYNPILNSVNNIASYNDLIAELSHPIQSKYGKNNNWAHYAVGFPKAMANELERILNLPTKNSYSPYKDKTHYEHETHSVIEPQLDDYILGQ